MPEIRQWLITGCAALAFIRRRHQLARGLVLQANAYFAMTGNQASPTALYGRDSAAVRLSGCVHGPFIGIEVAPQLASVILPFPAQT